MLDVVTGIVLSDGVGKELNVFPGQVRLTLLDRLAAFQAACLAPCPSFCLSDCLSVCLRGRLHE